MNRPVVFWAVLLAFGMILTSLTGINSILAAVALGLSGIFLLIWFGPSHPGFKYFLGMWVFALGSLLFMMAEQDESVLLPRVGTEVSLTGMVEKVEQYPNRQTLTFRLITLNGSAVQRKEYAQIVVPKAVKESFAYGQILRVAGKPAMIPETGTPGSFSYRNYLHNRQVYTQIKVTAKPQVLGDGGGLLGHAAAKYREKARLLAAGAMGEREQGILAGILFGDKEKLLPADKEVFTTTGVLHAFAVSGSNVVFVLFLGLTLLSPFPRPVQLSGTAVTLIFYAVLAGGEGPVVRATIMALIMLGGQGLGRKGEGLNSLALAATIMLIYNPNYLTDPGFQLSVAATWGLVALIPCLAHGMGGLHPQLRELLLFPVAATIATLPLLAYYFYQVSIVGIAANILVTWFLGLILEIGLIAVSIGLIVPFAGQTLLLPVGLLIKFTLWVLGMMAKVPGAALWVIRPAGFGIACYYLGLLLLINWPAVKTKFSGRRDLPKAGSKAGEVKAAALTKNGAAAGIFAVVLLVSLIVLLPSGLFGFSSKRQLEVDFLDVGQGDSILITTPGQRHYLIDGGPRSAAFDSGAAIVRPFLLNKGIKSLDGIFVTHLHDDHTGGLVEVVETFPIKRIYFAPDSGTVAENQGQWPLLKHGLLKHKLAVVTLKKGNRLNLDNGVTARVLSPESPYTGTRSDPNNNSLVLWLSYGNYNILLTGDIEMEALADLHDQLGKVDVLKQPHHGSKYGLDREAWDSINPQAVIVSVGRNNFGQPAPEILRYWQDRGIPVLRTDHDGLVAVKTDGHKLEFFLGRQQNKALLKR